MFRRTVLIPLIMLCAAAIGLTSESVYQKAPAKPEVGKAAPLFSGKTIDKKVVALKKLKGKLVLVDFWATWCPPCRGEIPHLQEAYSKYHKKGLEVVSVNVNETAGVIKSFIKKETNKMPWHHVMDQDGTISKLYQVRAIPSPFLIDHTGKLVAAGYKLRGKNLDKVIAQHIKNVPQKEKKKEISQR